MGTMGTWLLMWASIKEQLEQNMRNFKIGDVSVLELPDDVLVTQLTARKWTWPARVICCLKVRRI